MKYVYSNNGVNCRSVPNNYVAQSGEVIFGDLATSEQLISAFPSYAAVQAKNTAVSAAQAAIAAGIVVTSTATPGLDGTYGITSDQTANINAVATYVMLNSQFPGKSSTLVWMDLAGNPHTFEDLATFKAFASGIADFVAAVSIYANSGGAVGSIPSNALTIP